MTCVQCVQNVEKTQFKSVPDFYNLIYLNYGPHNMEHWGFYYTFQYQPCYVKAGFSSRFLLSISFLFLESESAEILSTVWGKVIDPPPVKQTRKHT